MEIQQQSTGVQTATLSVKVTPVDYQEQVERVLKDYARRANIKGFRPGKVPTNVVKKMFGKGVVFEELNKVLGSGIDQYLKENNVKLVGEPVPTTEMVDLESDEYKDYTFTFDIGLAPQVKVDYSLLGKVSFYNVTIDDEILNKEIEDMQGRYGPMTNPDESEPGDILYGKLSGGEWEKMFAINPTRAQSDAVKAELNKSHKAGDTFEVKMTDLFENDHAIRRFWETNVSGEEIRGVSDAELADLKALTFTFEVKKINRIGKLEVGAELYEKAFGEDHGLTSEEDFRARVAQDMANFFNREAQRYYRSKAIRILVDEAGITLPEEFLKDYLVRTREKIDSANVADMYPSYSRSLRWRLLVEHMQETDPEVSVTREDLEAEARNIILNQYAGLLDASEPDRLQSFVDYMMKDEKYVDEIFNNLLESRVFGHLAKHNPPVEESISATEFMAKLKAEN